MNHRSPALHLHRLGAGRPVLCLHSSSGSHAQWRALAQTLGERRLLLMPDLHGHGRSPDWPVEAGDSLRVDAEAALACADEFADEAIDIVGHSYGGALALQIALDHPERVRSLTLYEPVAFGLLRRYEPQGEAWAKINQVAQALAQRPAAEAGQLFTDYWSGGPGWQRLNPAQQATVAGRMPTVERHFRALFAADWGPRQLLRLQMPVQLIGGALTRTPARRVSEMLARWLPDARQLWLSKAGHLGPLSHGELVAALIAGHLQMSEAPLAALP